MATWKEVAPGDDVFSVQYRQERVARDACFRFVDVNYDVLEIALLTRVVCNQSEAMDARQLPRIERVVLSVPRNDGVHVIEAGQSHGRANLVHLPVRADMSDIVEAGKTEVPHESNRGSQGVVIGRHRAAFERVQKLRSVKAEHLGVTEATNHAPVTEQPNACAASNNSFRLCRRATDCSPSMSQPRPHR